MAGQVRRDWCEEHNRSNLAETNGLCVECQTRTIERLTEEIEGRTGNDIKTTKANTALISECDALKSLMKRREGFILGLVWDAAEKQEHLEREIASEREARGKLESAYRAKDTAMGVLFERLSAAGVDCSDLLP